MRRPRGRGFGRSLGCRDGGKLVAALGLQLRLGNGLGLCRCLRGAQQFLLSGAASVPRMLGNDFPAARAGLIGALPEFCARQRLERAPVRFQPLEHRMVGFIGAARGVLLEGPAERGDIALGLRDAQLLGMQRVALLLDDLVRALVLVARLLEQLLELFGILNAARRGLTQPARRALDDQPGEGARILDDAHGLDEMLRVVAQCRHGEQGVGVGPRRAKCGKIDLACIDELCHALSRCGVGGIAELTHSRRLRLRSGAGIRSRGSRVLARRSKQLRQRRQTRESHDE